MRPLHKSFAIAAAVLIAGCSSVLAPRPDRSKFFVLTATQPKTELSGGSAADLSIGLGPVRLPDYLDRSEIIVRVAPNRVDMPDNDRWAEPLPANFRSVLETDLASQLPNAQIVQFPWYSTSRLDYTIEVNVDRFERDKSGNTLLIARWTIHDGSTSKPLIARDSHFNETAKSAAMEDCVAAMSTDVGNLSVQIASEVRRLTNMTSAQASP
jgi:uncharacterized protein